MNAMNKLLERLEIEAGNWYDREKKICILIGGPCDYFDCQGKARVGYCEGCCRAG